MNTFYVNIAQNIGIENDAPANDKHLSNAKIKENVNVSNFDFSPVTESQVRKCIKRLESKRPLVLMQWEIYISKSKSSRLS